MASDGDEPRAQRGFHTYADDTPRDPFDTVGPPPVTYWAEVRDRQRVAPVEGDAETKPPSWPMLAAAGGAAMGLVVAVALGWSAARTPGPAGPAPRTDPAPSAPPAAQPPLQVVVTDPPPPPPVPKSKERLEVLPQAPPGPSPARAPLAYVPLAQAVIPVTSAPGVVVASRPPDRLPPAAPSVAEAGRDATAPATPAPRRYNDCGDAPTRAMAMVCRDLRLAEADRRMKRAYRAALAAGVPERALAEDQADWLEVREDAARVSRRAVADIYRQRTRELQAMAAEGRY